MSFLVDRLMESLHQRPLLLFTTKVFALLPACFLAWHYLNAFIAGPSAALAKMILNAWLPELIAEVSLRNTDLLVMSHFGEVGGRVMPAEQADNQLAFPINTRVLSYSIAFFTALHFASGLGARWGSYAWSLLALWTLIAIGLVSTAAKDLMLAMPEMFLDLKQTPPADAVALLYQFSALIVPPLAPILIWAYAARESAVMRSLFPRVASPAQSKD